MSQKLKTLKEKLRRAIRKELVEYDNLNTRKEDELEEAFSRAKKSKILHHKWKIDYYFDFFSKNCCYKSKSGKDG